MTPSALTSGVALVRDLGDEHVRVAEQLGTDAAAVVVVEEAFPPMPSHLRRQEDDHNIARRMLGTGFPVPRERPYKHPIGRLHDHKRDCRHLRDEPFSQQRSSSDVIGDMDGLDMVPTSYAGCAWTGYVEGIVGLADTGYILVDGAGHHYRMRIQSNTLPTLVFQLLKID